MVDYQKHITITLYQTLTYFTLKMVSSGLTRISSYSSSSSTFNTSLSWAGAACASSKYHITSERRRIFFDFTIVSYLGMDIPKIPSWVPTGSYLKNCELQILQEINNESRLTYPLVTPEMNQMCLADPWIAIIKERFNWALLSLVKEVSVGVQNVQESANIFGSCVELLFLEYRRWPWYSIMVRRIKFSLLLVYATQYLWPFSFFLEFYSLSELWK